MVALANLVGATAGFLTAILVPLPEVVPFRGLEADDLAARLDVGVFGNALPGVVGRTDPIFGVVEAVGEARVSRLAVGLGPVVLRAGRAVGVEVVDLPAVDVRGRVDVVRGFLVAVDFGSAAAAVVLAADVS